jgi:hypothetical protein
MSYLDPNYFDKTEYRRRHYERAIDDLREVEREERDAIKPRRSRRTARKANPALQARLARIRTLPGPSSITFNEYCLRADRMQPPLLPRKEWIAEGCPRTFGLAKQDGDFRKKIYDEWRYAHKQ